MVWSMCAWNHACSVSSARRPGCRGRCAAAGASVPPGAVATTRMPASAYSMASDAVIALMPPLAAEYGMRWMPRVATDDTLTITPAPRSTMRGSAARQEYSVVISERSISAWISASVNSVNGLKLIVPPTLLISTSTRPNAESACRTTASAPSRSRGRPSPRRRAGAAGGQLVGKLLDQLGRGRPARRCRPRRWIRRAVRSPMPCAAPVITTTLPANRPGVTNAGRRGLAVVGHRPPHGLLGPVGVRDDQRAGRVAVAGLEGGDDVDVVLRAQRVAPGRVAQHLLIRPLTPSAW